MYYLIFKAYLDKTSNQPLGIAEILFITMDSTQAKRFLYQERSKDGTAYLELYACPLNTDLRELNHYPSIEFSIEDFK